MEYVDIQTEKVPALGFGTWKLEGESCRKSVEDALETGYRHIDTAQAYGNESEVGKAIENSKVRRDEIWLTTKLWRDSLTGNLERSVDNSLERLRTDYVDLLLIHWPFPEIDLETVLEKMSNLVESGKVKNIGVSNFTASQIEDAVEISGKPIFTNQVEYHPFLNQDTLLEKCRSEEMMLTAYSPLSRGKVMGNETLENIGSKYGKSAAQVTLRWLIQQENVAAIPKASKKSHRTANFDIFDFELGEDEMRQIKKMTSRNRRNVNPGFAPDW